MLGSGPNPSQRRYRNWNPPLLGNLPDDFLRILPQQLDSIQVMAAACSPKSLACLASLFTHTIYASQSVLLSGHKAQAELFLLPWVCRERMPNQKSHFLSGPGGCLFCPGEVTV